MAEYIIAHDLGTSGDKATLFSAEGRLLSSSVCSYDTHYFNGTWAEQNADDWWEAVCRSTRQLLGEAGIRPEKVGAVSFSGQMMGCLCVDRTGRPLRPSIIWADTRALDQAAAIERTIPQEEFYRITGHRNTASYGVQKLMWIREHEPGVYAATCKVLNAKDYIIYRLTGTFLTEYSDANSMDCFDINKLGWSQELICAANIDADKLPDAVPSTHIAGRVTDEAASLTGLAAGTPVIMGAGDGVTANVGAGSIRPGKTYCCLGTSAWITTTSEKPLYDPQMRTVTWVHAVPGLYAPNGTMQTAGGAYSWLKNTICLDEIERAERMNAERPDGAGRVSPYDIINSEIEQSPPGANGVIFLPYLMGERAPRWNPQATGVFAGLRAETTRADILRSVLEGVTLNLALILDILRESADIEEIIAVGGGAKGRVWRRIMADLFGTNILVPDILEEAGSMGAAVIGGVGAGMYDGFNAIDRFLHIREVQEPDRSTGEVYARARERFEAFYHAVENL